MIGMLMLQLAKLAGASKVALLEPVDKKREMGKKLGADICIDPLQEDVKSKLSDAGMTWIRTVIECAGLPSTMEQAMELAGNKGTVINRIGTTGRSCVQSENESTRKVYCKSGTNLIIVSLSASLKLLKVVSGMELTIASIITSRSGTSETAS